MSETDSRDLERKNLRRLAEGDVGVLDTIWKTHGDRSFRHALWVTGRREDAEDVAQTVFLRLAGLGGELLGVRDLGAYLGAMIHHEAVAVSNRRAARDENIRGPFPLSTPRLPSRFEAAAASWPRRQRPRAARIGFSRGTGFASVPGRRRSWFAAMEMAICQIGRGAAGPRSHPVG